MCNTVVANDNLERSIPFILIFTFKRCYNFSKTGKCVLRDVHITLICFK